MTNTELLEQEEAYHKLNAELELKTRQLMKDVEAVMNKQTNPKLYPPTDLSRGLDEMYLPYARERSAYCLYRNNSSPISDTYSDYNRYTNPPHNDFRPRRNSVRSTTPKPVRTGGVYNKNITDTDDIIPATAKGMSSESLVRFLKAKAKLLQDELAQAKRDYTQRTEEWRKLQIEMKSYEEEKMKLMSDLSNAKEKIKKHEGTIASLNERLSLRDSENGLLKKQVELVKQDMKKVNLASAGGEAKLNKAKEEIDKLKMQLKKSQANEKEARDKCRAKDEEMLQSVRKLEKQKAELITGIKKQIYTMDNIKKQKPHFHINGGARNLENEIAKLID